MYAAAGCPDGAVKGLSGGRRTHTRWILPEMSRGNPLNRCCPIRICFLYDIKAMDADVHKACTGVENGRILENFTRLADRGENIFVRYPYIPGMNDDQVEKIAEFLHRWQQIEAELLPYHKLGNSKYRALEAQNVFEG